MKKKVISVLLAVVLILPLVPSIPVSALDYGLQIAGVAVTDENASDVLGDGTFIYDEYQNTLYVYGNCFNYDGQSIIYNEIPGLTVYITKDVAFSSDANVPVITVIENTTFTGPGTLTVKPGGHGISVANGAALTFDKAKVDVRGICGIRGTGTSSNEKLRIKNSCVHAIADDSGVAIGYFSGGIDASDSTVTSPAEGSITNGSVVDYNGNLAKEAKIVTKYDLYVAKTQVTAENAADIKKNGAFSYDIEENQLNVFKNCFFGGSVIDSRMDDLTVYYEGEIILCSVTKDPVIAVASHKSVKITGIGSLEIRNTAGGDGIYGKTGSSVTIENARINITGSPVAGIAGNNGDYVNRAKSLNIIDSYINATGTVGAIYDFQEITLSGCELLSPDGLNISTGHILNGEGKVAKDVIIGQIYNLQVFDVQVTDANASDIFGDGTFRFVPEQDMLLINGDRRSVEATAAILSYIRDLTVFVESDSVLTTKTTGCIFNEDTLITGIGKLTINADTGIEAVEDLTLTEIVMEINSSGSYGIHGQNGNLFIDDAYLHITTARNSKEEGAICGLSEGIGGDYKIDKPGGWQWKNGAIWNSGENKIAKEVIIFTSYHVYVQQRLVNYLNHEDIWGNGIFSYDYVSNTLTINGDHESPEARKHVIQNENQGLTIYCASDSTLKASGTATIYVLKDLTITGPGKLSVLGGNGIEVHAGAEVTVKDTDLYVYGSSSGFIGTTGAMLTIINSYVHAEARSGDYNSFGAMHDFSGNFIKFEGCKMTEPADGYMDYGDVYGSNEKFATSVKFVPDSYDLTVAGTAVTSHNAYDILGDGVFSYHAENNTLYVYGNYTSDKTVIDNGINGLTVYVAEDSVLSASQPPIAVSADTTITGPGSLNAVTGTSIGVMVRNGAKLTLERANVHVTSAGYAFYGVDGTEKLIINSSNLHASGSYGAAYNLRGGITVSDCKISEPANGKAENGAFVDKEGEITKVAVIKNGRYNIWVAGIQVTDYNKDDVLDDGGSVRFYDRGEYTLSALDEKYGYGLERERVLVLDNMELTKDAYYSDGKNAAQIYIDDDIAVQLIGENKLYSEYNTTNGIYIGQDYVRFYGNGSLYGDMHYTDKDAMFGEGSTVVFLEEVKVELHGKHAIDLQFKNDETWIDIWDNAQLHCYSYQTEDNRDYSAINCGDMTIMDHGELICEAEYNTEAMSTWDASFSSDLYDIRILQMWEFASSGSSSKPPVIPYEPEVGISVKGGVSQYNCRYIYIRGITSYATGVRFSYDTYNITPAKNNIDVWALLLPYSAPSQYNDMSWESSDETVVTFVKKGNTGATLTGHKNGTAILTATAPGGASAYCTVTVSGFEGPSFIPGDINGDGLVNNKDIIALFKYQSGESVAVNVIALDVNGDGSVNNKDIITLFKHLSGDGVALSTTPYTP